MFGKYHKAAKFPDAPDFAQRQHQNRLNSTLASVEAQEAMESAVGNYHMILDKWLATAAGAWALGMNPFTVPLPWGPAPITPPSVQVSQNQPTPGGSPEPSRRSLGGVAKGALLTLALLGSGGLGATGMWLAMQKPPAIMVPREPSEWEYRVKVGDHKGPWHLLPRD